MHYAGSAITSTTLKESVLRDETERARAAALFHLSYDVITLIARLLRFFYMLLGYKVLPTLNSYMYYTLVSAPSVWIFEFLYTC